MNAGTPTPEEDVLQPDEADLWLQMSLGKSQAREKIFACYRKYARGIAARQYRLRNLGDLDLADIEQMAFLGLLQSIDRYDPSLGIPFVGFASRRIRGSISDGIARSTEVRRQVSRQAQAQRERIASLSEGNDVDKRDEDLFAEIAVGLALGFILEERGDAGCSPSPVMAAYDNGIWHDLVTRLRDEVERLPEREAYLLQEHYLHGVDFSNIAVIMKLSKGRVSQLHRQALVTLRKRLATRGYFCLEL